MNDYAHQVAALRPDLLRIARRRMYNPAWAEDAVSETVLAALERPATFDHRASLKTWLVSILHNKLVDQVRRHARELPLADEEDEEWPALPCLEPSMAAQGPGFGQADPAEQLAHRQMMQRLNACLHSLPERQGRAVVLRDWFGHESHEVCAELGMSANNLAVTLHRARAMLRAALQPVEAAHPVRYDAAVAA